MRSLLRRQRRPPCRPQSLTGSETGSSRSPRSRVGRFDTLGESTELSCGRLSLIESADDRSRFGTCRIYTVAEDTLDADDPIFPRAATRVGTKFQTVVEDDLDESGQLVPKSTTGEGPTFRSSPLRIPLLGLKSLSSSQCTLPSFQNAEETARSGSSVGQWTDVSRLLCSVTRLAFLRADTLIPCRCSGRVHELGQGTQAARADAQSRRAQPSCRAVHPAPAAEGARADEAIHHPRSRRCHSQFS
jgi:hypothetical protein